MGVVTVSFMESSERDRFLSIQQNSEAGFSDCLSAHYVSVRGYGLGRGYSHLSLFAVVSSYKGVNTFIIEEYRPWLQGRYRIRRLEPLVTRIFYHPINTSSCFVPSVV